MTLLGLNELTRLDRWELERRCRALANALYLGDKIAVCRTLGRYKMFVSTADVGFGPHLLLDGLWESWLTVFMARQVKPGMNVVDAGANHGYYTLLFADLVGAQGKVAAFEPNPPIARLLRQSVAVNGFGARTTVFEKALVADDDVELVFHAVADEPKNARIVDPVYASNQSTLVIQGARLDTLLADWSRVDFMKVDVEGAEEAMIRGATSILERDRPALVLEFSALRCQEPAKLLQYLAGLYGAPSVIGFDSKLAPVSNEALLDLSNHEDWLLFYKR
ncbi:FkbM family methyltransferase [Brevundimonas sp.]|uniref:FkbM family methyltransferase n=1 Tax=Brevundimonas sp. TaxID=1871086 RepID=UPI002ED9197C